MCTNTPDLSNCNYNWLAFKFESKSIPEEWRPVAGFPNYEISNLGRLRNSKYDKIQRQHVRKNGYIYGNLSLNGKPHSITIHSLVFKAFIGYVPRGFVINHKNSIRTDNRASNLHAVTQSVNALHAHSLSKTRVELCNNHASREDFIREDFRIIFNTMKENNFSKIKTSKALGISRWGLEEKIQRAQTI